MKCSSFLLLSIVLCLLTQNGIGRFLLVKFHEESDPVEPEPVEPVLIEPGPEDARRIINYMKNAKGIVILAIMMGKKSFLCFLFSNITSFYVLLTNKRSLK